MTPGLLFKQVPTLVSIDGRDLRFAVRRVYCVGRNYVSHIREMKEGSEKDPPFFFQKPTDAVVPSGSSVPYPPATEDLQFEAELVVAIGARGRDVAPSSAHDIVFGYAVGIDLTRRDRQFECRDMSRPWEAGKSFDHSAPCGALRMSTEVGHLDFAEIRLTVNGEVRQRSDVSLMIWPVRDIIANLSQQYVLMPGDLIFTGTPDGVGPVVPGDRIEAEVAGLPRLVITIAHPETD